MSGIVKTLMMAKALGGNGGGSVNENLELIKSGTFENDDTLLFIDDDLNGNPFVLSEMLLCFYNKASDENTVEGYGKVLLNATRAESITRPENRIANTAGFFRKSGQQSTLYVYVKLIKVNSIYQFTQTLVGKEDKNRLGNETSLITGGLVAFKSTESTFIVSDYIKDGITTIKVGTDAAAKIGAESKYYLFGKRIG